MRFLKLKTAAPRANGATYKHALIVDAPRRFAPSNQRTETNNQDTQEKKTGQPYLLCFRASSTNL